MATIDDTYWDDWNYTLVHHFGFDLRGIYLLLYIIAIHVLAIYAVYVLVGRAVRAVCSCLCGRRCRMHDLKVGTLFLRSVNVATQCELAPDVEDLTVVGLRAECGVLGLRVSGLRAELETRVSDERTRHE